MEAEGGNVPREQTLLICKSVDVFGPIPPRTGRGYASGEWLVENKIATTRLRVLAIGNDLEVRLEDSETYVVLKTKKKLKKITLFQGGINNQLTNQSFFQ